MTTRPIALTLAPFGESARHVANNYGGGHAGGCGMWGRGRGQASGDYARSVRGDSTGEGCEWQMGVGWGLSSGSGTLRPKKRPL